jgi:hypothetical protein
MENKEAMDDYYEEAPVEAASGFPSMTLSIPWRT